MEITVFKYSNNKEVRIKASNIDYESGFLDESESLYYATKFISAAIDLINGTSKKDTADELYSVLEEIQD